MRCCNSCCCRRQCAQAVSSYETVCYCTRYVDVPMQIYYGPGYTELDCCQDTLSVLKEISASIKAMIPGTAVSSCCRGRCC
ncbi:hypothetical protein [Acidaminobacterium chupaoyuni]